MQVKFKDYYGQFVTAHNETGTGNIRLRVNTCKDLNTLVGIGEKDCDIETDISMDEGTAKLLLCALQVMLEV